MPTPRVPTARAARPADEMSSPGPALADVMPPGAASLPHHERTPLATRVQSALAAALPADQELPEVRLGRAPHSGGPPLVCAAVAADLTALEDETLAACAARGDTIAWATLYYRAYAPLVQYATSLGWDGDAAEDLAQDTLVRAWESLARFDARFRFLAWARVILFRLSASRHRKDRSQDRWIGQHGDGVGVWLGSPTSALGDDDPEDRRAVLVAALESLSASDRAVLLVWAEGAGVAHYAREIGENESTVRGQVFRAQGRLRAAFAAASRG